MVADALLDPDSEDYKFSHFDKLKIAQVFFFSCCFLKHCVRLPFCAIQNLSALNIQYTIDA